MKEKQGIKKFEQVLRRNKKQLDCAVISAANAVAKAKEAGTLVIVAEEAITNAQKQLKKASRNLDKALAEKAAKKKAAKKFAAKKASKQVKNAKKRH